MGTIDEQTQRQSIFDVWPDEDYPGLHRDILAAIAAAVQAERETQKRRDEAIINLIENDRRIDDDTALSYVNLIRAHYESE